MNTHMWYLLGFFFAGPSFTLLPCNPSISLLMLYHIWDEAWAVNNLFTTLYFLLIVRF